MGSMKRRLLLVPHEGLYFAFRLVLIMCDAGHGVNALCMKNDSIRSSRYLENLTTLDSWRPPNSVVQNCR